VGAFD